jgi:hypothetical protein
MRTTHISDLRNRDIQLGADEGSFHSELFQAEPHLQSQLDSPGLALTGDRYHGTQFGLEALILI